MDQLKLFDKSKMITEETLICRILLQGMKVTKVFQGQQSMLYCAPPWVENELVAEHMSEVSPNVIKLINTWTLLLKSKQPT